MLVGTVSLSSTTWSRSSRHQNAKRSVSLLIYHENDINLQYPLNRSGIFFLSYTVSSRESRQGSTGRKIELAPSHSCRLQPRGTAVYQRCAMTSPGSRTLEEEKETRQTSLHQKKLSLPGQALFTADQITSHSSMISFFPPSPRLQCFLPNGVRARQDGDKRICQHSWLSSSRAAREHG